VREASARLIADVYSGRLNPRIATSLAPLLNLQLRAIETVELQQRVVKLERLLADLDTAFLTVRSRMKHGLGCLKRFQMESHLEPRVLRSVLHGPDGSQAKQIVVGRDQRKVHDLSTGGKEPICGIAFWQRWPSPTLEDQGDRVHSSRIYMVEVGMGTARVFRCGNSQGSRNNFD
jgi:hypothetical protein